MTATIPVSPRRRFGGAMLACVLAAVAMAADDAAAQPADAEAAVDAALEDWVPVNAPDSFRFAGGTLRVVGRGGWLRSPRRYADFRLTAELRFSTGDADSGLFVRARPTGEFGPGWPSGSYQVQLRNPLGDSPFPPVGGLFRHGLPDGETVFDESAARRLFTGTDVWQTIVVTVAGRQLTVELNGETVTEAAGIGHADGYIGIQSETGELEIRRLEITEL